MQLSCLVWQALTSGQLLPSQKKAVVDCLTKYLLQCSPGSVTKSLKEAVVDQILVESSIATI